MTAPVSFREKVRFFSLAPRAPLSRIEIPQRSEPLTDPRQSVMLATSWRGAVACNSVS